MSNKSLSADLETLLKNADWLSGLSRCLLRDSSDAQDMVQETWLAALRSPPDRTRPERPWLAVVMKNVVRMAGRGAARRRAREHEAAELRGDHVLGADAALERLEIHRRLADMVLSLDEPYRTAVILQFYEGQSSSAAANSMGIPAGTLRWRVSEGLKRLRQQIQGETKQERNRWRLALIPVVQPESTTGTGQVLRRSRLLFAVLGTTLGLAGVALWFVGFKINQKEANERSGPPAFAADKSVVAKRPEAKTVAGALEHTMSATTRLGIALPTLAAAAANAGVHKALGFLIELEIRHRGRLLSKPKIGTKADSVATVEQGITLGGDREAKLVLWLTPRPQPDGRCNVDGEFTLLQPIPAVAATLPVHVVACNGSAFTLDLGHELSIVGTVNPISTTKVELDAPAAAAAKPAPTP